MAAGPAFGDIKYDHNNGKNKVKGEAWDFDVQIGGALKPNFILHGTMQAKTIVGPKINGVEMDNENFIHKIFIAQG
jgi:hypothetical protein